MRTWRLTECEVQLSDYSQSWSIGWEPDDPNLQSHRHHLALSASCLCSRLRTSASWLGSNRCRLGTASGRFENNHFSPFVSREAQEPYLRSPFEPPKLRGRAWYADGTDDELDRLSRTSAACFALAGRSVRRQPCADLPESHVKPGQYRTPLATKLAGCIFPSNDYSERHARVEKDRRCSPKSFSRPSTAKSGIALCRSAVRFN